MSAKLTRPVGTPSPYRISASRASDPSWTTSGASGPNAAHVIAPRIVAIPDVLEVRVEVLVLEPLFEPLVVELQRPRTELGSLIPEVAHGAQHDQRPLVVEWIRGELAMRTGAHAATGRNVTATPLRTAVRPEFDELVCDSPLGRADQPILGASATAMLKGWK